MTANKYRYHACGMFRGTDGNEYDIDIPSPFVCNSKEEALKSGEFGYRFMLLPSLSEPQLIIYEGEKFELSSTERGERCLNEFVIGDVIQIWTFKEFKENGGYIRILDRKSQKSVFIEDNDFKETSNTFKDCFPYIDKLKNYYIDNEAYSIEEIIE